MPFNVFFWARARWTDFSPEMKLAVVLMDLSCSDAVVAIHKLRWSRHDDLFPLPA